MKFGNLSDWESDLDRERTGVPIDIGGGRSITIKRAGQSNRPFINAYGELLAPVAASGDKGQIAVIIGSAEMAAVFAEHVVIAWDGIEDEFGNAIPYSKEAFCELARACPDLFQHIRTQADQRGNFQREQIERDKDQLGKSSRTKRNGGATAHV